MAGMVRRSCSKQRCSSPTSRRGIGFHRRRPRLLRRLERALYVMAGALLYGLVRPPSFNGRSSRSSIEISPTHRGHGPSGPDRRRTCRPRRTGSGAQRAHETVRTALAGRVRTRRALRVAPHPGGKPSVRKPETVATARHPVRHGAFAAACGDDGDAASDDDATTTTAAPDDDMADDDMADSDVTVAIVAPSAVDDVAFTQSMIDAVAALGAGHGQHLRHRGSRSCAPWLRRGRDRRDHAHARRAAVRWRRSLRSFPTIWGTATDAKGLANVFAYAPAADQGGYVNGIIAGALGASAPSAWSDRSRRATRALHRGLRGRSRAGQRRHGCRRRVHRLICGDVTLAGRDGHRPHRQQPHPHRFGLPWSCGRSVSPRVRACPGSAQRTRPNSTRASWWPRRCTTGKSFSTTCSPSSGTLGGEVFVLTLEKHGVGRRIQ